MRYRHELGRSISVLPHTRSRLGAIGVGGRRTCRIQIADSVIFFAIIPAAEGIALLGRLHFIRDRGHCIHVVGGDGAVIVLGCLSARPWGSIEVGIEGKLCLHMHARLHKACPVCAFRVVWILVIGALPVRPIGRARLGGKSACLRDLISSKSCGEPACEGIAIARDGRDDTIEGSALCVLGLRHLVGISGICERAALTLPGDLDIVSLPVGIQRRIMRFVPRLCARAIGVGVFVRAVVVGGVLS